MEWKQSPRATRQMRYRQKSTWSVSRARCCQRVFPTGTCPMGSSDSAAGNKAGQVSVCGRHAVRKGDPGLKVDEAWRDGNLLAGRACVCSSTPGHISLGLGEYPQDWKAALISCSRAPQPVPVCREKQWHPGEYTARAVTVTVTVTRGHAVPAQCACMWQRRY